MLNAPCSSKMVFKHSGENPFCFPHAIPIHLKGF